MPSRSAAARLWALTAWSCTPNPTLLPGHAQQAEQLARYAAAAQAALDAGLGVNAGHDLNRDNLAAFVREVPGVLEVSIGHALIADALELGYAATVQAYRACIDAGFAGCDHS